jgi:pyruvate/2-oxoglutarate dehydrogenase complex dihydrolipoamide acyltransferase (E2) component
MSDHAMLAPSSAPVWGHCSGSIIAAQAAPSPETEQTRNGTAAHWVAEVCLTNWKVGHEHDPRAFIGTVCPENGVVVDALIAEGAEVYVTDVIGTLSQIPGGQEALLVESRVHMPSIHEQNWGTLDAAALTSQGLFIWDYKHGHAKVEAAENLQLVDYLEGLRLHYGLAQQTRVVARVVQPFAYDPSGPVSEWAFELCDIRGHVDQLRAKAEEVMTNPTLTSGKHCRYCPGRGRCPALRGAVYNLIDLVDSPLAFDTMTGGDLATEREILLRGQTMLKARLEAIEDDLMHRVKNGDGSCGLSLDSVEGRLNWTVEPAQAITAINMLVGVDITRPHCDTPTQARARVPAEMRDAFDEAIKPLTKRNRSLKLVDSSDTLAARVFRK